ncbi:peptide MFS transporter [Flavilitoribacter nigricans]|uniref:MFS transporter n=1 Tax=Flavilitoribacter nigricans (strain ATCC 23147 / DSM 23189 / NBRC 102662 / NCIMB 1420 / SS-2) TaxID=1122177 RepID=A0A2D0NAP4_FLAN2|nr:peptide MFS transporter [Flavilitoribacter nigricans]PHN05456.1 MFS transporter [Flavilitoribacter nigricans DSM 23189 = NBRC 102662]
MEKFGGSAVNQKMILGHPVGLFVLFFTEMWERFSYYGMRALLVIFLTSSLLDGGWEWSRADALGLYGTYTMMVYFTPIIGGFLADRYLGYRNSVALGAFIMTLGHACMAVETPVFLYAGLAFLVLGNGFFKPNITSIISEIYKGHSEKKDGAYTIFYMGVNAGAFLGIMLCGYIGEKVGWSWGFGLAGIFMFFGMLQFWFAQKVFGKIGLTPKQQAVYEQPEDEVVEADPEPVPAKVQRDRFIVIGIFAFFTIFFWAAFEQAGGSMTIFARDYTDRILTGTSANTYKIIDTLLTIGPLVVITWVLAKLFSKLFEHYPLSNIALGTSFLIIWGIVIWKVQREWAAETTEVAATWFGILNSFFIITFAPLFSRIWESKYNPPGSVKFGMGLVLLGIGFGALAYGSMSIPQGAQTASVSMLWLILAYLFHTLGELCLSPVGLSYVSKLAPAKLIGLMFGLWYIAIGMGNKLAGSIGGLIDQISQAYSLSTFFLIFTLIPICAGILLVALTPIIKKLMHGIE